MNSTGSVGMTTFQITNRPVSGTTISRPATTSAPIQTTVRIARQAVRLRRDGICV